MNLFSTSRYARFLAAAVLAAALTGLSCNRDDYILTDPTPVIQLDSETGVYHVKVGQELCIAPTLLYADDASVEWRESDRLLSRERSLRMRWDSIGTHFVTLSVHKNETTVSEELRIEVEELEIPFVSLPFADSTVVVRTGDPFVLVPEIAHADVEGFAIHWTVDGADAGDTHSFRFSSDVPGDFLVCVTASNADGSDSRRFVLQVRDELPFTLTFPPVSIFNSSTDRFTFPGRGVMLTPLTENLVGARFVWSVDGTAVETDAESFLFTPDSPGEYLVQVVADGIAAASVKVVCVNADETSRFRQAAASSSAVSDQVYEWVPAPGQFIGETQTGGMSGNETTHDLARDWAKARLAARQFVSLGAFGGYIVVGFDHSIVAGDGSGYDFAIQGNAFFNTSNGSGGSNEAGIVYVMQDVNGNGLPDDEWFELRGSESGSPDVVQDYAVTYYRPSGPKMAVQWTDNQGGSGSVDYLPAFHRQDSYYPAWIGSDSYTLRGTRLPARTTQDSGTGFWDNFAFAWGYADNMGSDVLPGGDGISGEGQRNGFRIANAMYPDGTPVKLQYIDFIKVQTAIQSKSGWLGEVSTEVFGFEDLTIGRP